MRFYSTAENKQTPPVSKKIFLSNRKYLTGFTILEVLAAIFILTVGAGGCFLLIQKDLAMASINKDRVIAAYLAQEGIEIVKNIRDDTWLEKRTNPGMSWDDKLPEGDWAIDWGTSQLSTPYDANRYLRVHPQRLYNYASTGGGEITKFRRKVSISEVTSDSLRVTSLVEWRERGRTHSLTATEYLQNWYEQ